MPTVEIDSYFRCPHTLHLQQDVRLGKILIQTNLRTGEPELYYLRLPREIDQGWVFLMEATVATGAAAMMAIRVLLDHDVREGTCSSNGW